MDGFQVTLRGQNEPAGTDSWVDPSTGETYYYGWDQHSYGSLYFNIEQGALGYYIPINCDTSIYRYDEYGHLTVNTYITIVLTDEQQEWNDVPQLSINWDALGINYLMYSYIQHAENYLGGGEWEITNDIQGYSWFNFEDTLITNGSLDICNKSWWVNNEKMSALGINAYWDLQLTDAGLIPVANEMFALVPEPTTIALLATGALAFLRRR